MRLFVLRHGDAPYVQAAGERVLSAAGAAETRQVAAARREELQAVQQIICSPTRRARETLAAVVQEFSALGESYQGEISFDDCLRSESSVAAVEQFIDRLSIPDNQSVMLITHQPLVGQMVSYLADDSSLGYQMGTSCLAAFELLTFSRGCADLLWLDSPR